MKGYAEGRTRGVDWRVKRDPDWPTLPYWVLASNLQPTAHLYQTYNLVTGVGTPFAEKLANTVRTMSFSLFRDDAGVTQHALHAFFGEHDEDQADGVDDDDDGVVDEGPCTDCVSGGDVYVLSPQKGRMAHEVGHWTALTRVPSHVLDLDAPDSGICPGNSVPSHQAWTVEHQSAAAVEGWAHFWSSIVWNDWTQTDCTYNVQAEVDWNDSSSVEMTGLSCVGPVPDGLSFDGLDSDGDGVVDEALEVVAFDDDYCGDCCACPDGRANEFDYLRMYWGLLHDSVGYFSTPQDLLAVFALAGPDDWNAQSDGGPDDPPHRLSAAAYTYGQDVHGDGSAVQTVWDYNAVVHGTYR